MFVKIFERFFGEQKMIFKPEIIQHLFVFVLIYYLIIENGSDHFCYFIHGRLFSNI